MHDYHNELLDKYVVMPFFSVMHCIQKNIK